MFLIAWKTLKQRHVPKTCQHDNCNNPVFSKGDCKYHAQARYVKKRNEKLKEISKKPIKKKPRKATGELSMFKEIHKGRDLVSFLTGAPIPSFDLQERTLNLFAHVLSKKNYPDFRLYKKNIVLLTAEEHYLFDHGNSDQREKYARGTPNCDWEKLYKFKDELKEEYNNQTKEP